MFIVFITFAFAKSNATSFDGEKTTVSKIKQGSNTPTYEYMGLLGQNIGTDTSDQKTYTARTQYKFDLTSIPSNATIQNVTLTYNVYNTINGDYKFKITSISTKSNAKDLYNAINGTVLFSDITYGSNTGSKSNGSLTTLVNNKKGSKMYLGTFSQNESTIGSDAQVDLTLDIKYSVKFTVDNNFNTSDGKHGKVKIDGTQWTAPYLNTAYTDNTVHLEAIVPQTNSQGHQMIWHTGSIEKSKWERNGYFGKNQICKKPFYKSVGIG